MGSSSESKASARLLLVEDEEGARSALAKILRTYGHDVEAVEDGERAVEAFVSGRVFDVVLTDLSLPGMSGWEVAAAIKKERPDTPVVVLSGWDIKKDDKNVADSGVSIVMSKPIKVKDIVTAIDKLLRESRSGGESR